MANTRFDELSRSSHRFWLQQRGSDNAARLDRLQGKLLQAMDETLTARQRQILTLHFFQNMTVTHIAHELHLSKSSVSRTLHRGLEKLEKTLQYSL